MAFIESHKEVDIFCLQEIYHNRPNDLPVEEKMSQCAFNLNRDIAERLPHHINYFKPHIKDWWYGLAAFIKEDIEIVREGDIPIYDVPEYNGGGNHARNLQYIEFKKEGKNITVMNVHGLWNGKGKGDSEERLKQSDAILDFVKGLKTPYVLCGDFNLRPDTQSLKKFKEFGMRDLIEEYNITSTRTSLYGKEEGYADYAFISEGIEVRDFKVLPDEVSDHAALYLDFD